MNIPLLADDLYIFTRPADGIRVFEFIFHSEEKEECVCSVAVSERLFREIATEMGKMLSEVQKPQLVPFVPKIVQVKADNNLSKD